MHIKRFNEKFSNIMHRLALVDNASLVIDFVDFSLKVCWDDWLTDSLTACLTYWFSVLQRIKYLLKHFTHDPRFFFFLLFFFYKIGSLNIKRKGVMMMSHNMLFFSSYYCYCCCCKYKHMLCVYFMATTVWSLLCLFFF